MNKNKKSDILGLCFSVVLLSFLQMREIDQKIQKLEAKIMLDPKMYSLDPIRNHRIKVRLFNIARGELLDQDLKEKVKK